MLLIKERCQDTNMNYLEFEAMTQDEADAIAERYIKFYDSL